MAKVLKIEVDRRTTDALERAVRVMPARVKAVMGPRMRKAVSAVQTDARLNHRFTSRNGMSGLVGSMYAKVRDNGLTGEVGIADDRAVYGKFIHDGFKSWEPDPFVDNAFQKNLGLIEQQITLGLQKVIDELFK